MSQNPFEAPRAQSPNVPPVTGTGRFDIGQAFNDGWKAVTGNLGLVIGVAIVGGLAMAISEITVIGIFVLVPVIAWGGVKFVLNLQDGHAEFNDLFSGFQNYGQVLGSMLLLMLVMIVPLIPAYAIVGIGAAVRSSAVMSLGQLALFGIMLGVCVRLYFAPFFIVDRGMGAVDAAKASWEATNDQKLGMLGLALLAGVVSMVGALACGIGMFVSIPISYVMFASAYRQMVGSPGR